MGVANWELWALSWQPVLVCHALAVLSGFRPSIPEQLLAPVPPMPNKKTDNQTIEYNLQNIVSTPTVWLWVFGSLGEQVCCLFS